MTVAGPGKRALANGGPRQRFSLVRGRIRLWFDPNLFQGSSHLHEIRIQYGERLPVSSREQTKLYFSKETLSPALGTGYACI
jgi:hypothetical protein